jgi:hypothetical protein
MLDVALLQKRITCFSERGLSPRRFGHVQCAPESEEQGRPFSVVVGYKRKRLPVVALGGLVRVQGERGVACVTHGRACSFGKLRRVPAGGASNLECRAPVVCEHLGVVLGPAE